ncbi:MAG: peptidylprolyl isomerase [Calothrix sp. FI2-JRJ7]|jgi:peptidyl-prolyl cis-trans isomerase B (cyclophilin B)|nr:peptidylprolyl isomerase [Calothrix sp. FI2-JRJ7]
MLDQNFHIQVARIAAIITLSLTAYNVIQPPVTAGNIEIAQAPAPSQIKNLPRLTGKATVVIKVNNQPITIELDGTNAPISAGNFIDLVQRKVYDGLVFHRVVREPQPFVVQGGDPQSKDPKFPAERLGTGSWIDPATKKPRYVPLEIKPTGAQQPIYGQTLEDAKISKAPILRHKRGAVAMARSSEPNSASSQFYFALTDLAFLDGNYAVFGYVTKGMNVVDKIKQGDKIQTATVVKGIENLKKAP